MNKSPDHNHKNNQLVDSKDQQGHCSYNQMNSYKDTEAYKDIVEGMAHKDYMVDMVDMALRDQGSRKAEDKVYHSRYRKAFHKGYNSDHKAQYMVCMGCNKVHNMAHVDYSKDRSKAQYYCDKTHKVDKAVDKV